MSRKARRRGARPGLDLDYPLLYERLLEHHAWARTARAHAIYQKIAADDNPHALELFGTAALRHQEFGHAAALLGKATRVGRESPSLLSDLGLAQLHAGHPEDAERSLRSAIRQDGSDFRPWVNLGLLERQRGQLEAAAHAFEEALGRDPNNAPSHLQLAETLLLDKRPGRALEEIETALVRDPGSSWGLALESVALCELGEAERLRELVPFDRLVHVIDAEPPEGFRGAVRFQRALARHIRRHPALRREPAGFSTRRGSQTLGNLLRDAAPVVRSLESLIDAALETVLGPLPVAASHPQALRQPPRYRLEGWGVRLERGGHQTPHVHRDGWWSAVYYVDLGGVVDAGDSHAGWLELGRGPDALYPCGSRPETLLVRPQPGRFVIFPSYVWHRTIPFDREGTRTSFAFDVIPASQPAEAPAAAR